jgi:proteic killer suppression protein
MNKISVFFSKDAKRDLQKIPSHIVIKLRNWVELVIHEGILSARKIPGFHDEPLKGNRLGQRSIRLNKAYRAIYIEKNIGEMEIIEILEVNKHDY